ncbi:MAG: ATP-binding cassette subfamily B protein [Roseivirga sp.]|jgi:ATP-binding cassette subfamily B protein
MINFPHVTQQDQKDCGPTCIKIVAKHYKKTIPIQKLRDLCETTREGSSMMGLNDADPAYSIKPLTHQPLKSPLPLLEIEA